MNLAVETLVLNAGYQPLSFVSVRRAIVLVLKERAEIIEEHVERKLRAASAEFPFPMVIRLVKYVEIPRGIRGIVTNRVLFARDSYTCQYCGRHQSFLKKNERLTREHVKPISRGGATSWDNITTACSTCNTKKGNKLPMEVKMYPKNTPFEPRYVAFVLLEECRHEVHRKYIEAFAKIK